MQANSFKLGRVPVLGSIALVAALGTSACGGSIVFQDQSAIAIAGTPPAPPAPPPPKVEAPPAPPPRVELRADKIEIKEKIQFDHNASTIQKVSFSLLDEIADVIKKNPQIKKLSIEGHASAEGDAGYNKKLSDARAKAVLAYLTGKGIEASRLTAKGYGAEKPIASNDTDEGKEKNRRVEFIVLEQEVTTKKVEVGPDGKEKVVEVSKSTEKAEAPKADAPKPNPKMMK
ncbi:MAG: OmpA family protein [Polyangiaceae bacterium]|nr:OmpA family protein [Polyangiaceae bacterium]